MNNIKLLTFWARLLLCCIGLTGCQPAAPPTATKAQPAAALPHQLYIWQRVWTREHVTALAQSQADFCALRVLGLQYHRSSIGPRWVIPQPDLAVLAQDQRPVWLVVRLDGQLPQLPLPQLVQHLQQLVTRWQLAGVRLEGVELDYDSARSQLPGYRQLLRQLRPLVPAGIKLGITALPDWLNSSEFAALLQETDLVTLQLHSVLSPKLGLFDLELAKGWIQQLLQLSPRQFSLALPAYHSALITGSAAQPLMVESEVPLLQQGARQELLLDPKPLQQLLQWLSAEQAKAHLPGLTAVVWFRLPLPGDQRAWPYAVLQAVVRQQPLLTEPVLQINGQPPQLQLVLHNQGNIALDLPPRIRLQGADCLSADALQGYQLNTSVATPATTGPMISHYLLHQPAATAANRRQLAAGASLILGWWHCQQLRLTEGHTDETAAP